MSIQRNARRGLALPSERTSRVSMTYWPARKQTDTMRRESRRASRYLRRSWIYLPNCLTNCNYNYSFSKLKDLQWSMSVDHGKYHDLLRKGSLNARLAVYWHWPTTLLAPLKHLKDKTAPQKSLRPKKTRKLKSNPRRTKWQLTVGTRNQIMSTTTNLLLPMNRQTVITAAKYPLTADALIKFRRSYNTILLL